MKNFYYAMAIISTVGVILFGVLALVAMVDAVLTNVELMHSPWTGLFISGGLSLALSILTTGFILNAEMED